MPDYLIASIGGVTLRVMPRPDWGQVTREAEESENIYADIATQLRPRTSALRKPAFAARLDADTKDGLIALENALRAELAQELNTLTVRPNGATNTTTFKLLYNPTAVAKFDYLYDKKHIGIYELQLVAEPWGYGALETALDSVAYDGAALVPIGDLLGQGDPRLRLELTATAATEIQFACIALCTGGSAVTDYVYQAEDSDLDSFWYDYDGNTNCAGGHSAKLDAVDTTAWTALNNVVPAAGPPAGRYRVWARARVSDNHEGYIAKRKQYSTSRDASTNAELTTTLQWHDLGEWVHYGSDSLRLYGKAVTGGIIIDQVAMVPVDWGLVWYTDPTETTTAVRFGWLYDHQYTTDGTNWVDATGRMQGHGLKVPRSDYDLFVLVEPEGSDPTPTGTLDGTYYSRWEMFW